MAGILKVDRVQSDSNLAFNIAGSNVAFLDASSMSLSGSNISLNGTNVFTGGKLTSSGQLSGSLLQQAYNNFACAGNQMYTSNDLYWKAWAPSATTVTSKGTNSYWTATFTGIAAVRGAKPMSFDIWYQVDGGTWYSLEGNSTAGSSGAEDSGGFGLTGYWSSGGTDDWFPVNMTSTNAITAAAGSTIIFKVYIRNGGPSTDTATTNNMIGHDAYYASMTVSEIKG